MRENLVTIFKDLSKDRGLSGAVLGLLILAGASVVWLVLNTHVSDLQVVTRYTGFGITNYYRDSWVYLLSFVVYEIIVALVSVLIAHKIFVAKGTDFAKGVIIFGIISVVISTIIISNLLKIASLT